ncbi:MAG: phosphatase PAP2 family protein [Sporichthyaceae bacterium]
MSAAVWVAVATGAVFVGLALLVVGEWGALLEFDADAVGPVNDPAQDHDLYRDVMLGATWALNSQLILLYGAVIAGVLVRRGRRGAALWLALAVGSGSALGPLLKLVIGRDRPSVPDPIDTFNGLSFPSGHANSATLLAAALLVVFWGGLGAAGRAWALAGAVALVVLSSWSRLTLGAHYLSDIAGGMLLGAAIIAAWQPALAVLERRSATRSSARSR